MTIDTAAPARLPAGAPRRPASTVSVIIPSYQYAHYLPECLQSVLAQQGVELRVLVLDDASTDDTPAVVAAVTAGDLRVTYRRHETNQGHIATYNEGLEWADGDYTVLLSADDLLAPGALARAAAVLDAHPDVGFVYGRPVHFTSGEAVRTADTRQRGVTIWTGPQWLERRCRQGHGCITSPEVMVRTELQHRLGGYRADLPHTGDTEMWMRFATHGGVGYVRGPDQAYHRQHPASMSVTSYGAVLSELRHRKAAYDVTFDSYGARLPGASRLRYLAGRAFAREALWRACRAYDRDRLGEVPVEELVDFAASAFSPLEQLSEYRALLLRRRLGPQWSARLQLGTPRAVVLRIKRRLWWAAWKRRGG